MWGWVEQLRTGPIFEGDQDKTRIAGLLNSILPSVFAITSILVLVMGLLDAAPLGSMVTGGLTAILTLLLWFMMRRGYVRLVSILLVSMLVLNVTFSIYFIGSIRDPIAVVYVVCIVLASLLIGARAAIVFTVLIALILFGLTRAEIAGLLPLGNRAATGIQDWATYAAVFSMTAVLLNLAVRSINRMLDHARQNERVLAERAKEVAIFRSLTHNAADAILMSSLEGNITYANRACYRMFGYNYKQREMVGLKAADLALAEIPSIAQKTSVTVTRAGAWHGEFRYQRKNGSVFDAHNALFSIRDDAKMPVALGFIIRDVTEQRQAEMERDRLQQEVIEAHKQALLELSTPIIPVMDRIIVMPLIGSIDGERARDITRALLAGIREHRAKVVIVDITGVSLVDSEVANYLNKTIQAARLKGARTIVTGVSDAVAETIVDLGIDWSELDTLSDLQTGLVIALRDLGLRLVR